VALFSFEGAFLGLFVSAMTQLFSALKELLLELFVSALMKPFSALNGLF
jgi:hypothetical protein